MVIAVASKKGGTGKTTISISLAAGLGRKGKRVLLIDTDSQANSSKVLLSHYQELAAPQTFHATNLARQPLSIHPTTIPHLDIVPSHILLSNTDIELTSAIDHREARLKRQLDRVKATYDVVIIDCPPTLSWLTINAFTAAHRVLVVVAPGYFELDSVIQIRKTIGDVQGFFNPNLQLLGFLFTMSDPTLNSDVSMRLLRQTYTHQVLRTIIPRNTDIRDTHLTKQDIFACGLKAKAAHAYGRLISELFDL